MPSSSYSFERYDKLERWISYWYQIRALSRAGAKSVLLVGKGNGMVADYLSRQLGLDVHTLDVNAELAPDVLGDVRRLDEVVAPRSYDAVCAFQVLEHLPYADFRTSLAQMAKASRRHVMISLPVAGFPIVVKLRLRKRRFVFGQQLQLRPLLKVKRVYDGHKWEIALKKYPLHHVHADIAREVEVAESYVCPENPYHHFWECLVRP